MSQILLRARLKHTGGSKHMCFTQWEARRTVIPPPGPEAPKMLRENSLLFTGYPWKRTSFQSGGKG